MQQIGPTACVYMRTLFRSSLSFQVYNYIVTRKTQEGYYSVYYYIVLHIIIYSGLDVKLAYVQRLLHLNAQSFLAGILQRRHAEPSHQSKCWECKFLQGYVCWDCLISLCCILLFFKLKFLCYVVTRVS